MGASEVKEPLYVCVYVPEFPAQALLRLRPQLAADAVVVLSGNPPLEQVCSANAKAFKLGVTAGMTRAELDSFAGITVLRRSEQEERVARSALIEAAGAFTPRFEVQPLSASSFSMVLDMTGTTRIFGPTAKATGTLARSISTMRFFVQLAASSNFHTAVCMAPASRKEPTVVKTGGEQEALGRLPLHALGLTPKQAETLEMWGLQTLGELAELPETELVVRLGQEGKRLRLMARGELPHLLVPQEAAFTLEEYLALEEPVELLETLLYILGPMLEQLLARAQNRALALASVTVKLGLEGGGEHERTVKPALPVLQQEVLLKLLHLDLQAHPPSAGVVSVFVHAEPGDRSKVQLGLFAPQLPEATRLDVTLARIAALVGEGSVGRAKLADTHRPDAFTMERFTVPATTPKATEATPHSVALRRYRPPVPLLSVKQEGAKLVRFDLHGKRYTIREAYGPWRKSGDWWSAEVWSSEEWDVRAEASATDILLCLISHDLLNHQWQMEALYD